MRHAVMNNHIHVVLCVDKDTADKRSMKEVIKRWHQFDQVTLLSQKYQRGDKLSKDGSTSLDETVTIILNEYIAREANKEDKCTGRFYSPPSLALNLRAS